MNILAPCFVIICLLSGTILFKNPDRSAKYFTFAMIALTIGIVSNAFRNIGIAPDNFFTAHANLVGSVFEFIVLAIAIVDKIGTIEAKKNQATEVALESDKLAIQSRLQALQAQINPHFLFNTLNAIQELIVSQPARAEKLIERLSQLFRYTLTASQRKNVCLAEELAMIETYLSIEKERFVSRLEYSISVQGDPNSTMIHGLLIQPIVENSIKHGISPLPQGGKIQIDCLIVKEIVNIRIHDTGIGFQEISCTSGTGVGMKNVKERLALAFGEKGTLAYSNNHGGLVEVSFPKRACV